MSDAWRAYLEMALGLTEAPRKKAQKAAGELVSRGGATAAQLQGLVEDLMSTGMANREALTNIVRYEVDRALGVVGLATADEVADLTTRVRDLERQLRDAQARAAAAESGSLIAAKAAGADGGIGGERLNQPAPLPGKAAKQTVAKKAPAKKTVAKKAVAKNVVKATPNAMPAAATTPPAKKTAGPASSGALVKKAPAAPAKRAAAPANKTTASAKKTAAKAEPAARKAAAKRAPAKKTAPGDTPSEA